MGCVVCANVIPTFFFKVEDNSVVTSAYNSHYLTFDILVTRLHTNKNPLSNAFELPVLYIFNNVACKL